MKKILSLACVLTLLSNTGCIVAGRGGHARYDHHDDVVVAPVVVARPPVIVVRPPEIIVH
jgi:hypothetical protein